MKLNIFVIMSQIRFIYFLILSLFPSCIYAHNEDSGFSFPVGYVFLIIIVTVLLILYLNGKGTQEAQKNIKEAQKIKDYEEYQLKLEKALEGLDSEVIKSANEREIKEMFGIRSYDVGYYEPTEYHLAAKTKIVSMEELRWTDANGNLLKDSVYMCQLLTKKLYTEHRKLTVKISRPPTMSPPSGCKEKSIFIINGVYFSQDDCSWGKLGLSLYTRYRFAKPRLFNGKINGIKYIDGYPETRNHTNSIKG